MKLWQSKNKSLIQNQSYSLYRKIKSGLDSLLGCSWHVVVGTTFSLSGELEDLVQVVVGERCVLAWKYGTELMSEVTYL